MVNNKSLEEKVLEYWFTLEFLGQDNYPQKELTDALYGVKKLKAQISNGKKGFKSTFDFFEIDPQNDLYETIKREAEQCRMKKWGNITVYIGKVRREACVKCIAQSLPFENEKDERPERNFDDIACVSLQLTPEGKYIEHSLSLSTIIWAMKQVKNCKGRIADCLDEGLYRTEITEMENQFFPKRDMQKRSDIENSSPEEIDKHDKQEGKRCRAADSMQEFDLDAANIAVFEKIYQYIEKEYLKKNVGQMDGKYPHKLTIGISFQMFADEDARSKDEDDNYLGLSHDYFSNDLKMVLNQIRNGDEAVPEYVLDYISSTYRASLNLDEGKRIDLVHPADREMFARQVQEILNVRNAPAGKWPSKYMPAFMQQIAINLAIKKGSSALFGKNGEVFSVNGPPGTGKTTLLKEIVVNNIIERAILLAEYDNPEDAFDTHSFQYGTKQNHAYSQYTQHWYSLKEDKINEYSILVTSCNNAAVENISKELPLGSGILKDLQPSAEDSDEMKTALDEVGELFDFSKSSDMESYEGNTVECPDIYFTHYAQKLLAEENAWGLVAASLGKKKNIRDFYRFVLKPLRWDFYPNRDSTAKRLPEYQAAKMRFLEQKKRVYEMREQLAHLCDLKDRMDKLERDTAKLEESYQDCLMVSESGKRKIEASREEIGKVIAVKEEENKEILDEKKLLEHKKAELEAQIQEGTKRVTELHGKAFETINTVGKKPLLFGRAVYEQKLQYAQKAAADYDTQAEEQKVKNSELSVEYEGATNEWNAAVSKQVTIEKTLADLNAELATLSAESADLDRSLKEKQQALDASEAELKEVIKAYGRLLDSVDDGKQLDTEFISALLSEDRDISTEAQVANPWFTMRYNREREKLFYYAMKMNKAFILASKKCRDNFISLAHYWGLQSGDDKEKVIFHEEDRKACVGALYQTLFLLVPVISTTFASVGTFLRDVKDNNAVGTLIVDEAGQAQPQMAVGALYRSRKAIIVGDPKQVEPVVTDDLRLLKRAFDDAELKPYTSNKTISVQSCADEMNAFGTCLDNPEHPDFPDWIGCPLVVHRRCISPMYDISNVISYNGIMKKKTGQPKQSLEEKFIYGKSQWVQVKGKEKGNKNHFVKEQGDKVCDMLEIAFSKDEFPSLYIISPFTAVVAGIRLHIREYRRKHPTAFLAKSQKFDDWLSKNIGTVHTFQGKEANEVIFLLGCDGSKAAEGAVRWVNSNIVNVAVTRAKFRLYIIGDASVWKENSNLQTAKNIVDTFAIQEIHSILTDEKMDEDARESALNKAVQGLPPATSFCVEETQEEEGDFDYSVDTDGFVKGLETYSFMREPFTPEQLSKFGFSSQEDLSKFQLRIRKNIELGMRLYYFLQPIYSVNKDFDASCCAILFCKAMELHMKECLAEGLKEVLPQIEIRGMGKGGRQVKLEDARKEDFTLGTFQYIIKKHSSALGQYMKKRNEPEYDRRWWDAFGKKVSDYTVKRNTCCHDGFFQWINLLELLAEMFRDSGDSPKIAGLMFESEVGKRLKS